MRASILIFFLGLFGHANAQISSGQVYLLTEKLDDECTVDARCDCCASQLILSSDKVFVFISYCMADGSYWTGTYSVKQNKLILTFKQVAVTDTYDYGKNQKQIGKENRKIDPTEFEIVSCGQGRIIIKNHKQESIKFGERLSTDQSAKTIAQYKNSEPWRLLMK